MIIQNLIENTCRRIGLEAEHGLSFYIETDKKKVLFDTGSSDRYARNAQKLGFDLSEVDALIVSHGHYDHTGGMKAFMEVNKMADIYIQKDAAGEFFSMREEGPVYIGIPEELKKSERLHYMEGDYKIDEEFCVFTGVTARDLWPKSNMTLMEKKDGELLQDSFSHEQNVRIVYNGKEILLAGCGHSGIINIMEKYQERYGRYPNTVIGGFHLVNPRSGELDKELMKKIALKLMSYTSNYYTCHCTGVEAYKYLKRIMGDQVHYIATGERIEIF